MIDIIMIDIIMIDIIMIDIVTIWIEVITVECHEFYRRRNKIGLSVKWFLSGVYTVYRIDVIVQIMIVFLETCVTNFLMIRRYIMRFWITSFWWIIVLFLFIFNTSCYPIV